MDNFLSEIAPFIVEMQCRIDPRMIQDRSSSSCFPAWLVPAMQYRFRREKVYLETGSGKAADYLGGYNGITDEESMAVQKHLWTVYKDFYWAHELYCSAVLGPACLVLLTARRKRISLADAEEFIHRVPQDSLPFM